MVSILTLIIFLPLVSAFQAPSSVSISRSSYNVDTKLYDTPNQNVKNNNDMSISRRAAIATTISTLTIGSTAISAYAVRDNTSMTQEEKDFLQKYEDFTPTEEGWSFKEVKIGKDIGGGEIKDGDRVVFDWSGYTIGYFGRPFEAKGGPQGGAFDTDLNYFRTTLGSKTLIPGLECALRTMKPGGIRQVIIPYGALSYPPEDKEHDLVGPKPTTFSGMRALNFVLDNPRVDRTLLFNVKLIRVDRGDGKGGFIRG